MLCDQEPGAGQLCRPLRVKLAQTEPDVEVRVQLACSIRRLPPATCCRSGRERSPTTKTLDDPHVPLLLWWALEAKAASDRDAVTALFEDSGLWRLPLVEKVILERVMRRYAQAGTQKDLLTCARLLRLSPSDAGAKRLLAGFEQAYLGRPLVNLPRELIEAMAARGGGSLALRVRQGNHDAVAEALKLVANVKADKPAAATAADPGRDPGEAGGAGAAGELAQPGDDLRQTALTALQRLQRPRHW